MKLFISLHYTKNTIISPSIINETSQNVLNNITILSPLEQFEVNNLLSIQIPLLGYITISFTNLALYSLIVLTIIIGLHYLTNNENKLIPSKWSITFESIYTTILSIVRGPNRKQ